MPRIDQSFILDASRSWVLGSGCDNLGNLAKYLRKRRKNRRKTVKKSWKKLEKLREKAERIAGKGAGIAGRRQVL